MRRRQSRDVVEIRAVDGSRQLRVLVAYQGEVGWRGYLMDTVVNAQNSDGLPLESSNVGLMYAFVNALISEKEVWVKIVELKTETD